MRSTLLLEILSVVPENVLPQFEFICKSVLGNGVAFSNGRLYIAVFVQPQKPLKNVGDEQYCRIVLCRLRVKRPRISRNVVFEYVAAAVVLFARGENKAHCSSKQHGKYSLKFQC